MRPEGIHAAAGCPPFVIEQELGDAFGRIDHVAGGERSARTTGRNWGGGRGRSGQRTATGIQPDHGRKGIIGAARRTKARAVQIVAEADHRFLHAG